MNIQKDVYDEWGDLKDKKIKILPQKNYVLKKNNLIL